MVGFVLTGHGEFAPGLAHALEMVGGPQHDFKAVPFLEEGADAFPDELLAAIEEEARQCGEVVVFCDLMGGTPFNQAMIASASVAGVQVVTGANLPMLLECASMHDDGITAQEIVDTALAIGRMGIDHKVLEAAPAEDEACEAEDGDGI